MSCALRVLAVVCLIDLAGCSGNEHAASGSTPSARARDAGGGGGDFGNSMAMPASGDAGPIGDPGTAVAPPADFTATEIGGYKLGDALGTAGGNAGGDRQVAAAGCSVMVGVVRDFRGADEPDGHPDFQAFDGKKPTPGLVAGELGADSKPVYASHCEAMPDRALCPYGQMTTSRAAFDQWYRSTPGVNAPYLVDLIFAADAGVNTFQSNSFFPLDPVNPNAGLGKKYRHDFGFTTEIHARFLYRGGEEFTFTGDDDLWVFINGKLAIDLGGLHPPASDTIKLDEASARLGLTKGQTYPLDLFHAERHSASSNFRVDTTLGFTECGKIAPD